jgi:hypothetical protein
VRKTTGIIYGVTGQTVEYRVPQGRPTSATFKVFRDYAGDDNTPEFSGTATLDSVSQSVTAASGPSQSDPNRVNVVTTGMVTTRKYLISEGSRQEWFTPLEIGSGYCRARLELKNDFTTAATVVSTTITAAIDSTFIADLSKVSAGSDPTPGYRVRWAILIGGLTLPAYSFFDVERAEILYEVDIEDLNTRAPGVARTLPTEYRVDQGRALFDSAWRSARADLAVMGIDVDAIRDDESLDELVILKSLLILAEGGWRPPSWDSAAGSYVADRRDVYNRFLEQHLKVTLAVPISDGTTGGVTEVCAPRYFSK